MKQGFLAELFILSIMCLTGCDSKSNTVQTTDTLSTSSDSAIDYEGSHANIYDLSQLPLDEELISILAENKDIRIERIISTGQVSDEWYDQEEMEYVILVEGTSKLEYENGDILELNRGDTVLIPAHEKHKVIYTSTEPACIWICFFWNE